MMWVRRQNFADRQHSLIALAVVALVSGSSCGRIRFETLRGSDASMPDSSTADDASVPDGSVTNDASVSPAVKAFPTAEGYGQDAMGGRGGRLLEVSTLADSGSGSLRAALEASGPRIVVFRVSGTIELWDTISIRDPYVTVAGQTAPGDGVQIRNHPDNLGDALRIETHDVVMRHLRVRPGPTSSPVCCSDAIVMQSGAHDVVLDHLSLKWAVDEVFSSGDGANNYTLQWSVIAQGLNDSAHEKGMHSRGAHFGTFTSTYDPKDHHSITLHHNLFAHNDRSNPDFSNAGRDVMVNNLIYNWRDAAVHGGDGSGVLFKGAFVGNMFLRGPSSGGVREIYFEEGLNPTPGFELYLAGNEGPNQLDGNGDQSTLLYDSDHQWMVSSPTFSWPSITTTSAKTAYDQVLVRAGATAPVRDVADQYVVDTVINRDGGLVNHPNDVGGWPVLASGTPYPDADGDGMEDQWETNHGLDPADPTDGNTVAPNGYTWVENFLNQLAGDPV